MDAGNGTPSGERASTGKVLRRARIVVILSVLGLVALELGLYHLGGYGRTPATTTDDALGYRTLPNQSVRGLDGTIYRINDLGYRDRDWGDPNGATAADDGPLRVAVLGDSVTYGPYVAAESTWTRVLERIWRRDTGREVVVMNFAQPGYVFEQLARTYESDVRAFRPDVLILSVNAASARPMLNFPPAEDFPLRSFLLKTATYDYLRRGVFEDQRFLQFDRDERVRSESDLPTEHQRRSAMRTAPYDARHDAAWVAMRERCVQLAEECERQGTAVFVLCIPQIGDVLGEGDEWFADRWAAWISDGLDCELLDVRDDFRAGLAPITDVLEAEGIAPRRLWSRRADPALVGRFTASRDNLYLYRDPAHLNPAGHLRLAEWLARRLPAELSEGPPR